MSAAHKLKSVAGEVSADYGAQEKARIMAQVGDVSWYKPLTNRVLVAVYVRPEFKDLGGGKKLFLTDNTRGEDVWRGCVGLVLAVGPSAFVDDEGTKFGDRKPQVGDWVHYGRSDGELMKFGGVECILLRNDSPSIRAVLDRPDYVYGS